MMSVIIRLQNLPWSANALDIRQYFSGLSIPEGGVHIVGGELGDAFIAFSTDEDARQAFNRNNGKIKEVQISLLLSSRQEMQKVIDSARNPLAAFMQSATPALPPIVPSISSSLSMDQKKDDSKSDRRDRDSKRRSRSKSRDRRDRSDRSRDRDRRDRRRDRDRSRSRDRRDRRRDRRSRSRDRTRSKDRDRKSKDKKKDDTKRDSTSRNGNDSSNNSTSNLQESDLRWEPPLKSDPVLPANPNPILGLTLLQHTQLQRPLINSPMGLPVPGVGNVAIPNSMSPQIRDPWPQMNNMGMRNPNMDGPGPVPMPGNRMPFRGNNMDMDRDRDQQNNFNRMPGGFHNNMDNGRPNNGPNGHFQNTRPFMDNRMGFARPPMGSQFNRDMHTPPGPDFNNFNPNDGPRRMGPVLPNCCVQLRPYAGGYGEVRRFFNGAFINNTGLKFVNDESGKRTGIVYVRFVMPEGKQMALQRTGGILRGNAVEIKHLDDEEFDRMQEGFVRPQFQENNDMRNPHGPPGMHQRSPHNFERNFAMSNNLQNFSCIALEEIPNFTKEHHIMKMFSGYPLISFFVVHARKQREPCPSAYIKFMKPDDAKQALNDKSKHMIEGNPILIRPCSTEEFEEVSRVQNSGKALIDQPLIPDDGIIEEDEQDDDIFPNEKQSDCVVLSGLPFKITERDVADFFSDIGVVPTRIHMRSHGECFCEFLDARKAEIALEKNDTNLGTSVITVEMIPRSEMEHELASSSGNNRMHSPGPPNFNQRFPFGRAGGARPPGPMGFRPSPRRNGPGPGPMPGCALSMANIPYKASKEEIAEFFEGFDIDPASVLRRTENGKHTGDAIVTFNSPVEAQRAMEEGNHQMLGGRTIYLSMAAAPGGMKVGPFERNAFDA